MGLFNGYNKQQSMTDAQRLQCFSGGLQAMDPRPALPIPRDGMSATEVRDAMRAAWIHGCGSYGHGGAMTFLNPQIDRETAERLINTRREVVECIGPSGALYRIHREGRVERAGLDLWATIASVPIEDMSTVLLRQAELARS